MSDRTTAQPNRWPFHLSAAAFVVWVAVLAYFVAVSSNPVVVSRTQAYYADAMIEGRYNSASHVIAIEHVWWGENLKAGQTVTVDGQQSAFRDHASTKDALLVVPLVERDNRYYLAPVLPEIGLRERSEAVYPASNEVRRQVQQIADSRKSASE